MADQMMDPNEGMEPAAPEAAEVDDGSYTICIRVAADGSLSVGMEDEGAEDEYAGLKPAEDIKDALTQALAIYKQDGKATAESQFDSGFTGKVTQ